MVATQNYQKSYDLLSCESTVPATMTEQGSLYGKITQVYLPTPTCRVLQIWRFTDSCSWLPSYHHGKRGWALPLTAEYTQQPAYDSTFEALQAR